MFNVRSYEEIYRQIAQDLVENTPITNLSESSTALALVEAVSNRLADLHMDVEVAAHGGFVTTAVGEDLDSIGALMGVTRHSATRAFSSPNNFRFYLDPRFRHYSVSDLVKKANDLGASISGITIRQGTIISTADGGVTYTTTQDAALTGAEVYVPVVAAGVGSDYNVGIGSLTKHNIASNQLELSPIARYIACGNTEEPIDNGGSYESDNDYRERITTSYRANAMANRSAIRNAALSVPGVVDVVLNPSPQGPGTFGVVVVTDYAVSSQAVMTGVNAAVNQVAAYGTRAIVTTPELLAIELKLILTFFDKASAEERDTIKRDVRLAVIDYTNNIEIGGEWVVNEVIQRVMDSSDLIKDLNQEWFRVNTYRSPLTVLDSGRSQSSSAIDIFKEWEGMNILWANQKCRAANPPQKFLMLGKHLIVC